MIERAKECNERTIEQAEGQTPSPLAQLVVRTLRRQILQGELGYGTPLPSERALAERHSVSRTVVREAVQALAGEGLLVQSERCRPVVAGPATRVSRAGAQIGVWLWPHADDAFASSIVRGVQRAARGQDVRLVLGAASHTSWNDDVDAEARFIDGLAEGHAAGAILWYLGGERNLPALRRARERGVEFVFVDRRPPKGFEADFVGTENVGAARRAVAYLVGTGHRRIGFVGNLDTASPVAERHRGYCRALEDAGLESSGEFRFAPSSEESETAAMARLADAIVKAPTAPTAVFVVNDSVALQLVEALRVLEVRVPEDLSIVGFDGFLHWLPGGGPLTTIRQDFATLGELAGEALLQRFVSDSPSTYRHVLLDASLSLGGSTASPRTDLRLMPSQG